MNQKSSTDLVPGHLLQTEGWSGPGYKPVVDYQTWRTALMNFAPKYRPEALRVMEAHRETDEVFVLLKGRCTLFFGERNGGGEIDQVFAADMQPGIVYNVRKGAFHTHALSEDAVVLVVENADTGDHNTDFCTISEQGLLVLQRTLETLARRVR